MLPGPDWAALRLVSDHGTRPPPAERQPTPHYTPADYCCLDFFFFGTFADVVEDRAANLHLGIGELPDSMQTHRVSWKCR